MHFETVPAESTEDAVVGKPPDPLAYDVRRSQDSVGSGSGMSAEDLGLFKVEKDVKMARNDYPTFSDISVSSDEGPKLVERRPTSERRRKHKNSSLSVDDIVSKVSLALPRAFYNSCISVYAPCSAHSRLSRCRGLF